jgi:Flp pilus assembly protein TadG
VRSRRGATLITVCITITVLLGMVGVGVDVARAYAFKTQLKTVTDAAAMAGAIDVVKNVRGVQPRTTATSYIPLNKVNGLNTATLTSVDAVAWDFNTRTVTNTYADWDPVAANGVRVTATYSVPMTFARVFGVSTIPITETTIAAVGGVGASGCMKPWAVHYRALLNQLDESRPLATGAPRTNAYNLTADDVAYLSSNNVLTKLLSNNTATTSGGNIAQVATWREEYGPASSGNAYRDAIRGVIPCNMMRTFAPGDPLPASAGAGAGQTRDALYDFCTANGGATGGNGAQNPIECTGSPAVKLVMYTEGTGDGGANQTYSVKTTGIFKLKGYQPPGGAGPCVQGSNTNSDAMICGFFSTTATTGAFTGAVGMAQKPGIVF